MADTEQFLSAARDDTGLDDFGDPSFRDGLEVLVDGRGAARLSPVGDAVFDGTIAQHLRTRLRVVDWRRRHPECTGIEPDVAVVVLGLPRSGTTALSHLMGADRANRSLRGWEAAEPVPPPERDTYWTDPRFVRAMNTPSLLDGLNPGFKAMHHDAPDEPVECLSTLAQHFASISFTNLFNIAEYDEWIMGTDLTGAYEWHHDVLQVLQSSCPGPWQLKSPAHGYAIDALATRYPNALLVQTHRDPVRCIASTLSLVASLSGTFTDHDFRRYIGAHWPGMLTTILDRVRDHRKRFGSDRFLDISYAEVCADPVAAVLRIYERLGRAPSAASVDELEHHHASSPQHKLGRHEYSLEPFGVDANTLYDELDWYLDEFDVPRERPS